MTIIPKKVSMAKTAVERSSAVGGSDDALRTRGLRLTGPRRVVLEVVRGTDSHPTAERVHEMVRRRLPRVSLGTVYRNLRLLVAQGLVNELPGPHARFDGNVSDHHHFTCLGCGRIADVAGTMTEPHSRALCLRVAAQSGLSVTHHRIDFYGHCPACRVEPAASLPAARGSRRGHRGAPMSARAKRPGRPTKVTRSEPLQPDEKEDRHGR
jgi:Fe2+ or Zn2+ uptake regulation protein